LADGLGFKDACGAMLEGIERQGEKKARLGIARLMWISHSERPMKSN